jgi:hypothetical protein
LESIADRYGNGRKTLGTLRWECWATLCEDSPEQNYRRP